MRRSLQLLLAMCVVTGAAWAADDPMIGDWKLDPSKTRTPDEMKVASKGGNTYAFDFGGGTAETIVADGTDQPGIQGTTLAVHAEAPDTWIVERKKDGKLMLRGTWKLSKDGNTLTDYYREFESDGSTLSMDYLYQRVGGGTGFAADWQSFKETINSPYFIQVKAYQGDGLSLTNPSEHRTRNVKFDGKDYPNEGPNVDPSAASSARRLSERAIEITDKYKERVVNIEQIELSADSKTLTITAHFTGRDKPNVMVFERR